MNLTIYTGTCVNPFNMNTRAGKLWHTNALQLCAALKSVLSR